MKNLSSFVKQFHPMLLPSLQHEHYHQKHIYILLDQVILYGDDQGVKRVCWEVIDWNTPAIEFYEHKGARVMRDWDVVQLDEQGMKNYISKLK